MIGFPEVLLGIAVFVLPLGCIANWLAAAQQMRAGEPLLASTSRKNVDFGLVDLGVIILVVAMIAGVGVAALTSSLGIEDASAFEAMDPSQQAKVFLVFGCGTLLSTIVSFAWLGLRYQRVDGFSSHHIGSDIELGMRWFLMLVVPVILLQVILTRWFPTKHPLIEMLRTSRDLSFLPVAGFAAVIAAPIFEEVFFRLFMQGWLEKLQITMQRTALGISSKADRDAVLVGGSSSASLVEDSKQEQLSESQSTSGEDSRSEQLELNPFQSPFEVGAPTQESEVSSSRPILWAPILVSSGLFALAHFSHGPDWIPLFFLATGLGYLYQRTGRIQSCIVVHMLVNALGIVQLWAAVRQP